MERGFKGKFGQTEYAQLEIVLVAALLAAAEVFQEVTVETYRRPASVQTRRLRIAIRQKHNGGLRH
jgi:hypothetical protein